MKKFVFLLALMVCAGIAGAQTTQVVTFDDLPLGTEDFWNGSDGSGSFTSGGVTFDNSFTDWGGGMTSWGGWAYSNTTDTVTGHYTNQYSAITGGGVDGSANYGVMYDDGFASTQATLNVPTVVSGAYFTNTTYAFDFMTNGASGYFSSPPYGGEDGATEDWLLLTVTGKDAGGSVTGNVEFYLADYRSADSADDYIVDEWTWVDLSSLGLVSSVEFVLTTSNDLTPTYFAMDNLTYVPEPMTLSLLGLGVIGLIRRR